jgi:cytochrome c biogenesis protein ResB
MDRTVEAEGTTTQKDIVIEVNRPLRRGGLTFYQMAYEQSFDVVVRRGDRVVERVEAQSYVPFTLDSVEGMFFPGTLRVGTLYQKYLEPEPIVPHIPIKWQPPEPEPGEEPEPPVVLADAATDTGVAAGVDTAAVAAVEEPPPPHGGPPQRVEIGDLSLEVPLEMGDVTLMLENPYEGSILSYRHDPGVPLLYVAIVAFLLGLAIRTYWPSYRVRVWVEPTKEGVKGLVQLRGTGMLGEPDARERDLLEAFGGKTEKPKKEESKEEPPKPDGDAGTLDPSYFGAPGGGGSFGRAGDEGGSQGDAGSGGGGEPPTDPGPKDAGGSGGTGPTTPNP